MHAQIVIISETISALPAWILKSLVKRLPGAWERAESASRGSRPTR